MKNYSLKNALTNIITNKRGHYYGLMIIMAVLTYFGTVVTNIQDPALQTLAVTVITLLTALVREGIEYKKLSK
jgi:phosphatidylserine synthase